MPLYYQVNVPSVTWRRLNLFVYMFVFRMEILHCIMPVLGVTWSVYAVLWSVGHVWTWQIIKNLPLFIALYVRDMSAVLCSCCILVLIQICKTR